MKTPLTIGLLITLYLTITTPALGQTMSNDSYKLEQRKFDSYQESATGSRNKLEFTGNLGLTTFFKGTNYTVASGALLTSREAGSQSQTTFSFSISNTTLTFGKITPGEPIIRTNTLKVTSPTGYEVLGSETTPLKASGSAQISDTSCDQGNCSRETAAKWSSPLTYGFGYRCDNLSGTDCTPDFKDLSYYKSFANLEKQDSPQVIMQNINPTNDSTAQITYKVNIPGSQTPGQYQNTVFYIAVPSL